MQRKRPQGQPTTPPNILHKPNGRRAAPQPSKRTSKSQSPPASQLTNTIPCMNRVAIAVWAVANTFSRKLDCGVFWTFSRLCHRPASALSRLAHRRDFIGLADSHFQNPPNYATGLLKPPSRLHGQIYNWLKGKEVQCDYDESKFMRP
jgi:hypothetical protein